MTYHAWLIWSEANHEPGLEGHNKPNHGLVLSTVAAAAGLEEM